MEPKEIAPEIKESTNTAPIISVSLEELKQPSSEQHCYQQPRQNYNSRRGRGSEHEQNYGYGGYNRRGGYHYRPRYGYEPAPSEQPVSAAVSDTAVISTVPQPLKKEFTHFISIPLNYPTIIQKMDKLKNDILAQHFPQITPQIFCKNETIHLTILMLSLADSDKQALAKKAFEDCKAKIAEILATAPLRLTLKSLSCIAKKDDPQMARVVYVKLDDGKGLETIKEICNILITSMLANNVIKENELDHVSKKEGKYYPDTFHITIMNTTFLHKGRFNTINAVPVLKMFADADLGECLIESIHISTRFSYDEKGFYKPLIVMPILPVAIIQNSLIET